MHLFFNNSDTDMRKMDRKRRTEATGADGKERAPCLRGANPFGSRNRYGLVLHGGRE